MRFPIPSWFSVPSENINQSQWAMQDVERALWQEIMLFIALPVSQI